MANSYVPRLIDPLLGELMDSLPAISIVGPRACGKTTTATRHVADVAALDQASQAEAFSLDVDAALGRRNTPLLLDEWQEVPGVLGAVKRAVDKSSHPGQFVLTGSVRAELDVATWPGTGRVVRLRLRSLTEREIEKNTGKQTFLQRLENCSFADLPSLPHLSVDDYLERVTRGGLPGSVSASGRARALWLDSYVATIADRDVPHQHSMRSPAVLRRVLRTLAVSSAGLASDATLSEAAGVDQRTLSAHRDALLAAMVVDDVPAWHTNRLKRLTKRSKLFMADTGLGCAAGGVTLLDIANDADMAGRFLETFVHHQIASEINAEGFDGRLFHVRDRDGREVDLLVELPGGRVAGIEVKASSSPTRRDAKHLMWLRDVLGDRFVCGVVLHTGTAVGDVDDRITVLPISALWH